MLSSFSWLECLSLTMSPISHYPRYIYLFYWSSFMELIMLFCHSFPIFLPIVSTRHCCHCLPTHPTACGPLYPSPKIPDPLLDPAHTHPHHSPPCLAALVTPLGLGHYLSDYFSIGIPHHSWAPTSCASFPTLWNPSLLPTPCLRAP